VLKLTAEALDATPPMPPPGRPSFGKRQPVT
jgi:hypothetical protein